LKDNKFITIAESQKSGKKYILNGDEDSVKKAEQAKKAVKADKTKQAQNSVEKPISFSVLQQQEQELKPESDENYSRFSMSP